MYRLARSHHTQALTISAGVLRTALLVSLLAFTALMQPHSARASTAGSVLRSLVCLRTIGQLAPAPSVTSVFPATGKQGQTLTITLGGHGFVPGAMVDFGPGVTVNSAVVSGVRSGIGVQADHLLTLSVTIAADAPLGLRDVTVTNPDAQFVTKADAFTIIDAGAPPALASFTLLPATARGGAKLSGAVTLTLPAPSPRGAKVTFTSSNPAVKAPKSVTVKKGQTALRKPFGYVTKKVRAQTTTTLTATYGGVSKSVELTLTP